MRRVLILSVCGALALGACSSSAKKTEPGGSTTTSAAASPSTSAAGTSVPPSTGPATTTTTLELPTTSLPCQTIPVPTTPSTSPPTSQSVLLTNVTEIGDHCVDHVVFDFTGKGTDPPGYTVSYGTPPFTQDGSGANVAVAGNAYVVVKVKPGYGYDFESGKPSYTGSKRITPTGTNHVREIVETGDFEGVLTWVIGLDTKRPFTVEATGTPRHQLVVTVS